MKLSELLEGLGAYKTLGNFNRNHGFNEVDRRIIQNPLIKEKLSKRLGHLPYTVNMFFVNLPKASKHVEIGLVDLEWVHNNLGEKIYDEVEPTAHKEGHINIIYTNNKGSEKVPMTPWMMMHRMAHALARYDTKSFRSSSEMHRQFEDYSKAAQTLLHVTADILEAYNSEEFPRSEKELSGLHGYYNPTIKRDKQLTMKALWSKLATFRSARQGNIRDYFEILNELFAQYMITGDIKFNEPPQIIVAQVGKGWGAKRHLHLGGHKDDPVKYHVEDLLEALSSELKRHFDNLLKDTARGILVM